ncbi:MAG TPA: ABC transporter permease [Thermoanaerobaculia bacterium]
MDSVWQDLRFGARSLLRNPGVVAPALITLALGIGANTAIFSVVNGVLLRPLPFPRPEQLVVVVESAPKLGYREMGGSPPNFHDWRRLNQVFASLDAVRRRRLTLTGAGAEPQALAGAAVTGDFFRTLGVQPLAGRLLQPADDRPGAEGVVVLGADLWQQRFGGDPGILQRPITIDGRPHTVVGIAPSSLQYPRGSRLWVPLALDYAKERRGAHYLHVLGRMRPGVSLARAQADMSALAGRLERQYPAEDAGWGVVLMRLQDLTVEDIRPVLAMLQLAVWVVLLIGCANVANLLLARMGAREREIAVRAALGAGRRRLARQIVAESVILFAAGGALGLLVALWGTRSLIALDPDAIPRSEAIGIDARVLAYTLLVSVATGVVCGLVPALTATRGPLYGALRQGSRAISGGRRGRLARSVLVLGEVALALTLLVGAGLLIRSFGRLQAVDPGFEPQGVIAASLALPESRYPDPARQGAFFQRALDRIGALPGVEHAAATDWLPLAEGSQFVNVVPEGGSPGAAGEDHSGHGSLVSPDYFAAMKIPLLEGRSFDQRDDLRSPPVTIVSRFAAARLWPGRDALGRRVTFGRLPTRPEAQWWQVIGVVGNVRDTDLAREPQIEIYVPQRQISAARSALVVRTAGDPRRLIGPIRRAIQQLDPELALDKVQTLEHVVSSTLAENRVKTSLLGLFAALALALAAVGVYGLVSHSVGERAHEIGIRMALGAQRGQVVRMIVRQGMKLVAAGLVLGLAGAYAFSRLLAGQLYEVGIADPSTYGAVPLVLAAIALLANWLPARRATGGDALAALRHE